MSLESMLGSEPGLTLVGAVVGGAWAWVKSSDWWQRRRQRRYGKAVRALEAGVQRTYRGYVRQIKQGRADGRLTEDEKRHAREMAIDTAESFGRTEGVRVAEELGREYLDLWTEKLVNRMKRA